MTRRTVERKFLLRPSEELNQIVRYLLALYASRHGVLLHAFALLSNHMHVYKTDDQADMPGFMRDLNSQTTKRLNRLLDRQGPVWDERTYGNVEVHGEAAAWDKLVYVMTNPIKHRLVESPDEWPGLLTTLEDLRRGKVVVERPDLECFKGSTLPKRVELEFVPPPALAHLPRETFFEGLERRIRERLELIHEACAAQGKGFLGAEAVLNADREDRPKSPTTHSDFDPRISCMEEDPRRCVQLIAELRAWRSAYAAARRQWSAGIYSVVFPQGTYALRVFHKARSARADL